MPDGEAGEELFAALYLNAAGAGSFWPGIRKSSGDLTEALVIGGAAEGNGAECGAEKVCVAEANAFVIVVASEVAGIGGFAHTRVAKGDDISEMVGDSGNDVAGPDVVVAAYIWTKETGWNDVSLEGSVVCREGRPSAPGKCEATDRPAGHGGNGAVDAGGGVEIRSAQEEARMSGDAYCLDGAKGRRDCVTLPLRETTEEEGLSLGFDQIFSDIMPASGRRTSGEGESFSSLKVGREEVFATDLNVWVDAEDEVGTIFPGAGNSNIASLPGIETEVFEEWLRLWCKVSRLSIHIEVFDGVAVATKLRTEIRDRRRSLAVANDNEVKVCVAIIPSIVRDLAKSVRDLDRSSNDRGFQF